ncbi:MAG: formate dehydrogenase accessory sulfurtransferase FdhD [Anaerolineae bacterium]
MGSPGNDSEYLVVREGEHSRERWGIPAESPLTLWINGRRWVTLMCTPHAGKQLALGFAYFAGAVRSLDDVLLIEECADDPTQLKLRLVRDLEPPPHVVVTAGCGQGASVAHGALPSVPAAPALSAAAVLDAMRSLHAGSDLHRTFGGTHASALSDGTTLLALYEDVGRHNTVDKLMGHCLLTGLTSSGRVLLTSGRLSSEMIHKAVAMQVSAVVSRSTPTDMALSLAIEAGLTVYGYVRGRQLTVFSGAPPLP